MRSSTATIKEADERVGTCVRAMEDPEVAGDHAEAPKRWEELEAAKNHVKALYARWEEMEARATR